MANVETIRDEYRFLGSGCNIRTHLLEWRLDYKSILSRSASGRAVAHDEERRASNGWAKGLPQVQIWIPGRLSEFVVSGTGRECTAQNPRSQMLPVPRGTARRLGTDCGLRGCAASPLSGENNNKIVTAISIRIDSRLWNWPD